MDTMHSSLFPGSVAQAQEQGVYQITAPHGQEAAYLAMRAEDRPAGQSVAAVGRSLPSVPLFQARVPQGQTIPYLLSTECQCRGFNPEWRVHQGVDQVSCDIVLNWVAGKRSHTIKAAGRHFPSEREAKEAMGAEALAVVRSWPTSAPGVPARAPAREKSRVTTRSEQHRQKKKKLLQQPQKGEEQQAPANFTALSSSARELSKTAQVLAQRVQDLEAQLAAVSTPQQQGVRTRSQSPPMSRRYENDPGHGLYRARSPLRATPRGTESDSGRHSYRETTNNNNNRRRKKNNNPDRHYSPGPGPFDPRLDHGRLSPPPGLERLVPRSQAREVTMRDWETEQGRLSGYPQHRAHGGAQNLAADSAMVQRWEHDRYIKKEEK
ncbi:uncharacterized protein C8A04DRAFT_27540 [Dichotomopilus funicola]|uniref:Uncharacterized protein n=1 Tax=Dichotomopilus funicola TaxID=1934379 RepID=A0AAN6V4N3_9PEZI|nr:hypothetical protein C8A04DRAFT_27540 [Dichotomopilus funicola]